jgi:tetratricopeptide (TPR) repeat protein
MFESLRKRFALPQGWQPNEFFKPKVILSLVALAIAAAALVWFFDKVFVYFYARSYVEEIAATLGLNKHLATALVWIVFALTAFLLSCIISFSKSRRSLGYAGLLTLVVGQALILYLADKPFNEKGVAQKCYVMMRDSIRYGERAGIDPGTGLECKPLTPEIAERVERYAKGDRPKRLSAKENPVFFAPSTGSRVVWYSRNKNGIVEIFDLMGYHPETGEELLPITKDIVEIWKDQNRQAPERIYPDENYAFFDPVTGQPTAWHRKTQTGEYEFYNRPGFNPRTGEALLVVDLTTISAWRKYLESNQGTPCYVLTKDSVRYGSQPGIDVQTGRQCRPFSAEMLERLREYEKGNRPKKIETANPTFFDLRSGEPVIWYAKNRTGTIELFSLMGFHPDTGEELLPITKEIVATWKDQQAKPKRVPQKVDPNNFVFFDQISGEPRAWYWRGPEGQYEFYDGHGFNPRTGDPLTVLTKDLVIKFQKEAAEQAKKQTEAEAASKRNEEEAANKRRDELDKVSQSEKRCDLLAANPNDQNRVGEGVPYDARLRDALEACEIAVKQNPAELRLQYQLARVLQLTDRKRAFVILQKLVSIRYPAAFDNIGWIFYVDQKNPQEAVSYFRKGVDLNDTDSMLSLAEMIDRGYAVPRRPAETKLALYHRAAQLGNKTAANAEQVELQKQGQAEVNRELQIQQARVAGEVFSIILQGMSRR